MGEMHEKNAIIICALICITLIICGMLFWPTLYRYDKYEKELPVRINRLTGYTEILYDSGWERKVSEKELQAIPKTEFAKIEIKGLFDGKGYYELNLYNGSEWNIKKIRLYIGLKQINGKKFWEKIYEKKVDVKPFSVGSCSIKLMDYASKTPDVAEFIGPLEELEAIGKNAYAEIKLESALGYKSE
jgi:hypothetical protein